MVFTEFVSIQLKGVGLHVKIEMYLKSSRIEHQASQNNLTRSLYACTFNE